MKTGSLLCLLAVVVAACGGNNGPQTPSTSSDCSGSSGGTPVQLTTTTGSQFFGTQPGPVTWVAAQDGTCGWQRLDSSDGNYRFSVKSGRYGLAIACPGTDDQGNPTSWVSMFFLTTGDATSLRAQCSFRLPDTTPTHDIALNFEPTSPWSVRFWIRDFDSQFFESLGAAVTRTFRAASGTHDVVVGAYLDQDGVQTLDKLLLARELDSSVDQAVDVDVTAPGWITPGVAEVRSSKKSGEAAFLVSSYLTRRRTRVQLGDLYDLDLGSAGEVTFESPVIPQASRAADELHDFQVLAIDGDVIRGAEALVKDPVGLVLSPPDANPVAAVACAPGNACILGFDALAGVVSYQAAYSKDTPTESRRVFVTTTPGYLTTGSGLYLPDFSAVPGWNPAWGWGRTGESWLLTTVTGNRGFAGEVKLSDASFEDQPLAELEGLTRSTYSQQVVSGGS